MWDIRFETGCPRINYFGPEQCTVREENGKLIAETDKFTSVREIQGDNMVEVSDPGLHFLYKSVMFYFLTISAFSSSFRLSLLAL